MIGLGGDAEPIGAGRGWFHLGCYLGGDPRNEVAGATVPVRPVQVVFDLRCICDTDD